MPNNYSIYAIPVFYVLNLVPKVCGDIIITGSTMSHYNNANPRSSAWQESFRKRTTAATYARWERAKAAHTNGNEAWPLLVAAVTLGNIAKLDVGSMNWALGLFMVFRALYIVAYIQIADNKWSWLRSIIWNAALLQCMYLVVKAGNILAQPK